MRDKICIFNLWWSRNNYGAMLTSYALQKLIQNLGYDSENYDNMPYTRLKNLKNNNFGLKFCNKFIKSCARNISLDKLNDLYNIFVVGSDQVFRVGKLFNDFDKYFLNFVNERNKKVAFAVSFGVDKETFLRETSKSDIEKAKISLKLFDFISVREKAGLEICSDILGIDAKWIIDPVFILERNSWDTIIESSTQNYSDKIVSYVLDSGKNYKKAYKYLKDKYKLKIVETANSNIQVGDWLKSIRDCKMFVTDSFHGMCFAIIFNKPFICVANKERGSSRFDSICEMLGIENQCIDSILEVLERDGVFKYDYAKVNERIKEERQDGLMTLKKVLEMPISITEEKKESYVKYLRKTINKFENECTWSVQLRRKLWEVWLNIFYKLPNLLQLIIYGIRRN